MGSQITKIPSICGDQYPGIGYQVDCGESVRVAMAWPSASAGGWRSLTMEVPKKLSPETELNGVSVETLLKSAGELFEDNDLDGFRRFEQMIGDKLASTVVRLFARYALIVPSTQPRAWKKKAAVLQLTANLWSPVCPCPCFTEISSSMVSIPTALVTGLSPMAR